MSNMRMSLAALAALTLGTLAAPEPAAAHCDSLDGPVVKAARQALTTGNVDLVMVWVRPQDAPGIRAAFERTLRVRAAGGEARELADLWFFETLVRVHRMGEGASYTGLKPAGYEPPTGIAAAEQVLETGSIEGLASRLADHTAQALRERYERVKALSETTRPTSRRGGPACTPTWSTSTSSSGSTS